MFERLQTKIKKALMKVGAFIEASAEAIEELIDGISGMDFD